MNFYFVSTPSFLFSTPHSLSTSKRTPLHRTLHATSTLQMNAFRVAIVGGGVSGSFCALRLSELSQSLLLNTKDYSSVQITLFDTGKHAIGGRASSRSFKSSKSDASNAIVIDHAAQFFTVSNPVFQHYVDRLLETKIVQRKTLKIASISSQSTQKIVKECDRYVVSPHMGMLCPSILDLVPKGNQNSSVQLNVRRPEWVSKMKPQINDNNNTNARGVEWILYGNGGRELGVYDKVVFAHNGKCAERLAKSGGVHAKSIMKLLRAKFTDVPTNTASYLLLNSLWSVAFKLKSKLEVEFDAAYFTDHQVLSFAASQNRKLGLANSGEYWTLLSNAEYGKLNKVAQESKAAVEEGKRVSRELIDAFGDVVGVPHLSGHVEVVRSQLWGAAVGMNVLDESERCVWDNVNGLGICGDWIGQNACVESAAISGIKLAECITNAVLNNAEYRENNPNQLNIGLNSRFCLNMHDSNSSHSRIQTPIGAFSE